MAQAVIGVKLIIQYAFGEDSHGNPTVVKQSFSGVKRAGTDEQFKATGDALSLLINSNVKQVQKEELISLDV